MLTTFLRGLAPSGTDADGSDRQLLERFSAGDQEAFALLVQRHGGLVLNVCRRLLRNEQDAEDAFQATFLVLARKAAKTSWEQSIVGWLHEVAWRSAAELRGRRARQALREAPLAAAPDVAAPEEAGPSEFSCLVDEELRRLPDKYRVPLALCYLEGRSRDAAAELLGWSEGSVKGRLERGRELLRRRLERRGVALSIGLAPLLSGLAQGAPSLDLLARTAALGGIGAMAPSAVAALAQSILAGLARGRLRTVMVAFSVLALAVGAGVVLANRSGEEGTPPPVAVAVAPASKPPLPVPPEPVPPVRRLTAVEATPGPTIEHGGTVDGVALSGDGRFLASAAFNDGFTLFNADNGAKVHQWARKGAHTRIVFSPDDCLVAAGTITGAVAVFDVNTKEEKVASELKRGNVFALAFSGDSRTLAVASADGSVVLFAAETGELLQDLKEGARGQARSVLFTSKDDVLLVGGEDGVIRFWDWRGGKELEALPAHADRVIALAISGDGKRLVSAGQDRAVSCWDLEKRQLLFSRPCESPNGIALSRDGAIVACATFRGIVNLWAVADGSLLCKLNAHPRTAEGVAFSMDGRRMYTAGGTDKRVAFWDLRRKFDRE
ncbi:MAG: sigma-70 family RNA polymerase sigma factor [Gemmataceae bacterium]